jgi:putative GTP pyrophosphokinase
MTITDAEVAGLVGRYHEKKRLFELFLQSVEAAFLTEADLNTGTPTVVHSIRSRLKDENHFAEKIRRKDKEGKVLDNNNLFNQITDLAGLRVLHLYQAQFARIDGFIRRKVKNKTWRLVEKPVAYTWDPESEVYFKGFKIRTELKPSYYTSVHYLVAPANDEDDAICCEVQVRTLFEEAWGEIDHAINYPEKTQKLATVEQLRVLSKLVSTGSRLADSIFIVHGAPADP